MSEAYPKPKSKLTRIVIITCLTMVAALIAGGVAFFMVSEDNNTSFITLKADTTPIRIKPDDVGGKKIDHQDAAVLQMLDELKEPDSSVDRLVLPDANPELPPVSVVESVVISEAKKQKPVSEIVVKPLEKEITPIPVAEPTIATPTPKPTSPKSIAPKIITQPDMVDEDNPQMMVQLAAFREQAKAEQVAAVLTQKHKPRLQSLQLGIMLVDTGSSGVFWRVITEPISALDARRLCGVLKAAGQDCILRPVTADPS